MIGKGLVIEKDAYFRDNWNCLDFFVVASGWWSKVNSKMQIKGFEALRNLRILKPLKTITKTKKLKIMMFAMINAAP